MVHNSVVSCIGRTPLVRLQRLFPQPELQIIAKLEMLNPGGSTKDRPARFIIEQGLKDGTIHAGTHLIESTSGNFGIALAMIAQVYGLTLTCVVDPNALPNNLRIMHQLGACVEMVKALDAYGGYLHTRLQRVQELLATTPQSMWINQYANQLNWQAYATTAGAEILEELDEPIDCLIASVSTTGTIMGLSRCLRQAFPTLHVIAVDAVGSIIFGAPPAPRRLPGIGSSRVPELLVPDEIDEVVYANDWEAAQGCRALARYEGILAGGSSGAVIAATQKSLSTFPPAYRALLILPDRGERYLDLVYNDQWVEQLPAASTPGFA